MPGTWTRSWARQFGMVVASLIEPALQVLWGTAHSPIWANGYVGVHLLVFNLVGVHLFRRHGFVTMYTYRVAYYMIWHIAWGYARLPLLFEGAS